MLIEMRCSVKPVLLLAYAVPELLETHRRFFSDQGYEVQTALGGVDCLAKLRHFPVDLLVMDSDLRWGGSDGVLAVMRQNRKLQKVRVLLITDSVTPAHAPWVESPVAQRIPKPTFPTALLAHLPLAPQSDPPTKSLSATGVTASHLIRTSGMTDLRTLDVLENGNEVVIIEADGPRNDTPCRDRSEIAQQCYRADK
jgi:DNA-binding response OmpR family regulator